MPKFKNTQGTVIETNNPATANDYRTRPGWTEVKPGKKADTKADDTTKK